MKEGYLQSKIADFSEMIQDFEHRLKMAETEFERYQIQLGSFKQLLKKLKKVEEFQDQGIEKIKMENTEAIDEKINFLTMKAEKKAEKVIDQKTKLISNALKQIKIDEEQFKDSLSQINNFHLEIQYYKEFQQLFMLKLINKGILNHRELKEVELRAKKRVKQME